MTTATATKEVTQKEVRVKWSPKEYKNLERRANARGVTVNEYIRTAVEQYITDYDNKVVEQ